MGKRTEFARDTIEVCRNCKAEGMAIVEEFDKAGNHTGRHKEKECIFVRFCRHVKNLTAIFATRSTVLPVVKRFILAAGALLFMALLSFCRKARPLRTPRYVYSLIPNRRIPGRFLYVCLCGFRLCRIPRRATLRNATNRCGGILCTLSIRCVTTRSSAIFGVGWRDSPTSPATHSPPYSTT